MPGPAWMRYANEPDALWSIAHLHREQAERDPRQAAELLAEAADIDAYLRRTVGRED